MIDDEDRFTELCRRYRHRIVGYVLRRTGSVDDADDVTAEVFLVAWRRIDDVSEDAEALPWLYATACRVCGEPSPRRTAPEPIGDAARRPTAHAGPHR